VGRICPLARGGGRCGQRFLILQRACVHASATGPFTHFVYGNDITSTLCTSSSVIAAKYIYSSAVLGTTSRYLYLIISILYFSLHCICLTDLAAFQMPVFPPVLSSENLVPPGVVEVASVPLCVEKILLFLIKLNSLKSLLNQHRHKAENRCFHLFTGQRCDKHTGLSQKIRIL